MTDLNEWEKQLLSWTPRRPSARLERQLFAAKPATAEALAPFRFGWIAPATAALALMCVLFNQRYVATFSAAGGASPMVALILSNQSAPAYLPGSFQPEQNNLPADAFKWVSRHGSVIGDASPSQSRGSNRP